MSLSGSPLVQSPTAPRDPRGRGAAAAKLVEQLEGLLPGNQRQAVGEVEQALPARQAAQRVGELAEGLERALHVVADGARIVARDIAELRLAGPVAFALLAAERDARPLLAGVPRLLADRSGGGFAGHQHLGRHDLFEHVALPDLGAGVDDRHHLQPLDRRRHLAERRGRRLLDADRSVVARQHHPVAFVHAPAQEVRSSPRARLRWKAERLKLSTKAIRVEDGASAGGGSPDGGLSTPSASSATRRPSSTA